MKQYPPLLAWLGIQAEAGDDSLGQVHSTSLRIACNCFFFCAILAFSIKYFMQHLPGFLSENEFFEHAKSLLSQRHAANFDTSGARNVLARAFLYEGTVDMYGKLLSKVLVHSARETEAFYIETDASLLAEFIQKISTGTAISAPLCPEEIGEHELPTMAFNAMDEYSDSDSPRQGLEFIRMYLRSALQLKAQAAQREDTKATSGSASIKPTSLDGVATSLGSISSAHPALVAMVRGKLMSPTDILNSLAKSRSDASDPLQNTAFFTFLAALRPLVASGVWYPENDEHYSQLWLVHTRLKRENVYQVLDWEENFTRNMINLKPHLLDQALAYMVDTFEVPDCVLDTFVPLPLRGANKPVVLEQLVQLSAQERFSPTTGKAPEFLTLLGMHHPDILQLLRRHLSSCSTCEDAVRTSENILDAFEEICNAESVGQVATCVAENVF